MRCLFGNKFAKHGDFSEETKRSKSFYEGHNIFLKGRKRAQGIYLECTVVIYVLYWKVLEKEK